MTAASFSPDGVLLATGDRNGGLYVWEARTGNPFYTLKGHSKAITALSWRADSNVLASGSEDGGVRLWEMNGGKGIKTWTAHGGGVLDVAYTANGHIVSCGRDLHAKVWDGAGAQKTATKDFGDIPVATCFSHDGSRYVAADWSGAIKVFQTADSKALGTIAANPQSIASRLQHWGGQITAREAAAAEAGKVHAAAAGALAVSGKGLEGARAALARRQGEKGAADSALKIAQDSATRLPPIATPPPPPATSKPPPSRGSASRSWPPPPTSESSNS